MKLYKNLENNFVSQTPYNGFQERHVVVTILNALAFFQNNANNLSSQGETVYLLGLGYGVGSLKIKCVIKFWFLYQIAVACIYPAATTHTLKKIGAILAKN